MGCFGWFRAWMPENARMIEIWLSFKQNIPNSYHKKLAKSIDFFLGEWVGRLFKDLPKKSMKLWCLHIAHNLLNAPIRGSKNKNICQGLVPQELPNWRLGKQALHRWFAFSYTPWFACLEIHLQTTFMVWFHFYDRGLSVHHHFVCVGTSFNLSLISSSVINGVGCVLDVSVFGKTTSQQLRCRALHHLTEHDSTIGWRCVAWGYIALHCTIHCFKNCIPCHPAGLGGWLLCLCLLWPDEWSLVAVQCAARDGTGCARV